MSGSFQVKYKQWSVCQSAIDQGQFEILGLLSAVVAPREYEEKKGQARGEGLECRMALAYSAIPHDHICFVRYFSVLANPDPSRDQIWGWRTRGQAIAKRIKSRISGVHTQDKKSC
jgi:hypothetical protein